MGTKIQINSLEALERLIGGDSETEIEIRNSVVQEFSKKHLKSIANDALLREISKMVEQEVVSKFCDIGVAANINGFLRDKIVYAANSAVSDELHKAIRTSVKTIACMDRIDEAVSHAVERISGELTDYHINKRIDRMVEDRIKEKLGIK